MNGYELGALLLANSVANLKRSSSSFDLQKFALTSNPKDPEEEVQEARLEGKEFLSSVTVLRVRSEASQHIKWVLAVFLIRLLCLLVIQQKNASVPGLQPILPLHKIIPMITSHKFCNSNSSLLSLPSR